MSKKEKWMVVAAFIFMLPGSLMIYAYSINIIMMILGGFK